MLAFQLSRIWSHFIKDLKDDVVSKHVGPNYIKEDFNGSESELQIQCHDDYSHETPRSSFTNFGPPFCPLSIRILSGEYVRKICKGFALSNSIMYFRVRKSGLRDPYGRHALALSLLSQCQGPGHFYGGEIVTASTMRDDGTMKLKLSLSGIAEVAGGVA